MAKSAAFGISLLRGAVEIANVSNIVGPGLSVDYEDVTSHDSTDGWEELVPTIKRSGSLTLDLVFDPAAATHKNASGGLMYDLDNLTVTTYTLQFANGGSFSFSAFVTQFEPNAPVGGALTATCTLKPTGKVTISNPA